MSFSIQTSNFFFLVVDTLGFQLFLPISDPKRVLPSALHGPLILFIPERVLVHSNIQGVGVQDDSSLVLSSPAFFEPVCFS